MLKKIKTLYLLLAVVNINGYGQIQVIPVYTGWPNKTIKNELISFLEIYSTLKNNENFTERNYPLSTNDAVEEKTLALKEIQGNNPFLNQIKPANIIKNIEGEMDYEERLKLSFISIIRQRLTLEKYRFAYLKHNLMDSTIANLQVAWDSTRWHLFKYQKLKGKGNIGKNAQYLEWYGDFQNLQNIFSDLETISDHFRLLWEEDYNVENALLDMPKGFYTNKPKPFYLKKDDFEDVEYFDMAKDVVLCLKELERVSIIINQNIADTANMGKVYSKNKIRWKSTLEYLEDSFATSKTILEDSVRFTRRKADRCQREADSLSVLLTIARNEKDSLTGALKTLTKILNDSATQELLLTKMRRQYSDERDTIYSRCGDPNCKDSVVINDLKIVNGKLMLVNQRLDTVSNYIDRMQKQKKLINKLLTINGALLTQMRQIDSEIKARLNEAAKDYKITQELFFNPINTYNTLLKSTLQLLDYSEAFFALTYSE